MWPSIKDDHWHHNRGTILSVSKYRLKCFLTLATNLYLILLINELKYIENCTWKNRAYIWVILWYGPVIIVE